MAGVTVNLEDVVTRLAAQVGNQAAELAMRDAALEAAQARIADLDEQASESSDLKQQLAEMHRQRTALERLAAEKDAEIAELRGRDDGGPTPALVPA